MLKPVEPDDDAPVPIRPQDAAEYIAGMLGELVDLARQHDLKGAAACLSLAREEALRQWASERHRIPRPFLSIVPSGRTDGP